MKAQIVYVSHGGGPLPILGDPGHRAMVDFMVRLPEQLRKPEAALVISAHWEESVPTLLGAEAPPLLYDYYGFPEEAYAITYPAPGDPGLANTIAACCGRAASPPASTTGGDSTMACSSPSNSCTRRRIYPAYSYPSSAGWTLAACRPGRSLAELRRENILVVGSGFSFHNQGAFSWQPSDVTDPANDAFQDWLIETCTGLSTKAERENA